MNAWTKNTDIIFLQYIYLVKNKFKSFDPNISEYLKIMWIYHFSTKKNQIFIIFKYFYEWKLISVWQILIWFFRCNQQNFIKPLNFWSNLKKKYCKKKPILKNTSKGQIFWKFWCASEKSHQNLSDYNHFLLKKKLEVNNKR